MNIIEQKQEQFYNQYVSSFPGHFGAEQGRALYYKWIAKPGTDIDIACLAVRRIKVWWKPQWKYKPGLEDIMKTYNDIMADRKRAIEQTPLKEKKGPCYTCNDTGFIIEVRNWPCNKCPEGTKKRIEIFRGVECGQWLECTAIVWNGWKTSFRTAQEAEEWIQKWIDHDKHAKSSQNSAKIERNRILCSQVQTQH